MMKITIRKPLGYSQIGRKDQQEDAVWPLFPDVTKENHCIVLCDGVGGSAHGEIASQTASKVIGEYLTSLLQKKSVITEDDIQEAVTLAYDELEKVDISSDGTEGGSVSMATTLTCVCIHEDGISAAHMGDSRIYHVRPGQGLLYQSADHSLVNALLQAGEITIEEAKTFPRKNVITKAIQPHASKRFKAESHILTDVQSGDYIFLCCDGVLEQLSNEKLVEILSADVSDEKKIQLLEAESTDRTKDNYTAYLIPIDIVEGISSILPDDETEVEITSIEVGKDDTPNNSKDSDSSSDKEVKKVASAETPIVDSNDSLTSAKKKSFILLFLVGLILIVIALGALSYYYFASKEDSTDTNVFKSLIEKLKPEEKVEDSVAAEGESDQSLWQVIKSYFQ